MFGALNFMLALSILLGLLHILLAATLVTASRGLQWNLGNRDGEPSPVSVHAARAQRACGNFLETFPFFAAAVVCVIAISRDGHLAQLGAQIYFWARVAYLLLYLVGVPVIRSLVWAVSMAGLLMVVVAIL
ncbi:MAG: MAPEG family protein [Steroidobacteraceae bacterium]